MKKTKKLTISAILVAIGIVLPMAFHMIPNAGRVFLPMHLPVLIAGFVVGPWYGFAVGLITPMLSSLLTSMPPYAILPAMTLELGVYGLCTGLFVKKFNVKNNTAKIYAVLITSMLLGRVASGLVNGFIIRAGKYSMQMWITGSFVTALPGICIQLVVVPLVVNALIKAGYIETK